MKKIKSFMMVVGLLFTVLTIAACTTTASAEESYVTIDINPSVELIVNGRERVVYANALNEDAEVLLAELDLIGMKVDEATDLIIETAINLGFIDVEATDTVVQVSTMSETDLGERIRSRVKEAVNEAFRKRGVYGKAEDKGFGQALVEEADTYGVTPGFLLLAKAVVAVQDDITLEDALLMTQEELRTILKDAKEANKEILHELRDEFIADRQAIHDVYDPQIEVLEAEIETLDVEIEAVEAQIEVESTEALLATLASLQTELATAQAELQTLRDAMHAELQTLRESFFEQSEALMPNVMARVQQRKEQYRQRVQHWIEAHNNGNWQDRVEEYQQGRGRD